MKYHPDKNKHPKAEEIFKKISAAFKILTTPEKRRIYDQDPSCNIFDNQQRSTSSSFNQFRNLKRQPKHIPSRRHFRSIFQHPQKSTKTKTPKKTTKSSSRKRTNIRSSNCRFFAVVNSSFFFADFFFEWKC